jgi:hypothetical protein
LPSLIAGFVIITPEYLMTVLLLSLVMLQTSAPRLNESHWEAARAGDFACITAAIDQGADVNARAPYRALRFAWRNSTEGTYIPTPSCIAIG